MYGQSKHHGHRPKLYQCAHEPIPGRTESTSVYLALFLTMCCCGYGLGYFTRDMLFTSTRAQDELPGGPAKQQQQSSFFSRSIIHSQNSNPKMKGDTIHSVMTCAGDHYSNWQARIMYASYKLVQKEPGGERLTGFTRLLHRTVPDVLMDEIPTFRAEPATPQCEVWCEYPVANRPHAIKQFFEAVAKNESMIQGAWVFMLETDYVWMQPMQVPGSAWDPSVPGVQFLYDYIIPTHPNAIPSMRKLYKGDVNDIPASGPSPVLMRLKDWYTVVPTYFEIATSMESDAELKKALGWVREMYAWDAALARHKDTIKMRTELHTNSTTIVQPPFDEALGPAAMTHYTWGVLYHEGLASKGAKQAYRFEKRDYNKLEQVLKPVKLATPPEYKEGWILEFDAPLNIRRHKLSVLQINQMNRAIETLPDLTQHWQEFQPQLKEAERQRDQRANSKSALATTGGLVTGTHR